MRARHRPLSVQAFLLVVLTVAVAAAPARAQPQVLRVVAVPGLELSALQPLVDEAAIGLLVPGAGPEVSEASALAALVRGEVRNSLRGGLPAGPVRIAVEIATAVPPEGPVIVLGLPQGGDQPNDRRYPIAVRAPGYAGLLTSRSTRIPGLVSIADVAPTALGDEDRLSSTGTTGAASTLEALDRRIADNSQSRPLAALLAGLELLVLAAVAPWAAVLGFGALLAVNLVLGTGGTAEPWLVLLLIGLAVGPGSYVLSRAVRSPLVAAGLLALVIVGYLVALGVDGPGVALSPLGPTQNARFFGLSNLLSAVLIVPALTSAALVQTRLGWTPAILIAGISLVTVAGGRFGADGGTALALVAAYALLAVELAGARRRAVAAIALLLAAAVTALVALDAVTGAMSHLTDAVSSGPGGLAAELRDRVVLSWERATQHWYLALLVAVGIVALALLVARLVLSRLPREQRALPVAVALAVAVSLAVNDSPLDVVGMGLFGYLAVQGYALSAGGGFGPGRARPGFYRSVET